MIFKTNIQIYTKISYKMPNKFWLRKIKVYICTYSSHKRHSFSRWSRRFEWNNRKYRME